MGGVLGRFNFTWFLAKHTWGGALGRFNFTWLN